MFQLLATKSPSLSSPLCYAHRTLRPSSGALCKDLVQVRHAQDNVIEASKSTDPPSDDNAAAGLDVEKMLRVVSRVATMYKGLAQVCLSSHPFQLPQLRSKRRAS